MRDATSPPFFRVAPRRSLTPRLPVGRALRVAGVLALAATTLLARQQPTDDTTFADAIAVTEVRVPVEFPSLDAAAVRTLTPSDLVVLEGELQREVTRLGLIAAEASPWTVLVYFDEVLAKPATLPLAAQVLSESSRALTRLGRVRVVEAGRSWGEHREVLRPTGNAAEVAEALAGVARNAANRLSERRGATAALGPGAHPPSVLRQRADRLILEAAACNPGPCLLVLVSDGWFPEGGEAESDPLATEVARVLAGYGWTTLALPLARPEPVEVELGRPGAGTDFESWKEDTGGVVVRGTRARRVEDAEAQELDDAVLPELGPLRLWAAAGAGAVVRSPANVAGELQALRERWWVYFRTQRAVEGDLRPLRVRFSEVSRFSERREASAALGLADRLEAIRAPRWIRSASPRVTTEARLRALRQGATLYGDFYVAGARTGGDAISWETSEDSLLVRLTSTRAAAREATTRLVEVVPVDGKARIELLPEERGGVLIVDELATGRWGPAVFAGTP
ncbi:MAG TPA: hypothetical protein VMV46_06450 [Thermoanaerobaculia bacterium]|nr:hypothetical protein [Thermoanaerobaculia bacterium]